MEGQFSEKYKTKKSESLITLRLSHKIIYSSEIGSSSILVKDYFLLVITTRFLSSSKLARLYICLLIVLSLFTCPSTGPLLQLDSNP